MGVGDPIMLHPRQINVDALTGSGIVNSGSQFSIGLPTNSSVSSTNLSSGSTHSHAIISSNNPGQTSSLLSTSTGGSLTLQYETVYNLGIGTSPPASPTRLTIYSNDTNVTSANLLSSIDQYTIQTLTGNFSTVGLGINHYVGSASGVQNAQHQSGLSLGAHIYNYSGSLSNVNGVFIWQSVLPDASGSINHYAGLTTQITYSGSNTLFVGNMYGIRILDHYAHASETIGNFYGIYIPSVSIAVANYSIYTNSGIVRLGDRTDIYNSSGSQLRLFNSSNFAGFTTDSNGYLNLGTTGNQFRLNYGNRIQSDNYTSQASGWGISYDGSADFRYVYTDELHAKAFIADLEQALAGGQIIAKSVAILSDDFTLPTAGNSGSFYVLDFPSADSMQVFQDGDQVGFRNFVRSSGSLSIYWAWGTVSNPNTTYSGYQSWTFTRHVTTPGTGSGVVSASSLVLDFGTDGNGYYEVNSIDGLNAQNSPYSQIVTWSGSPSNRTTRVRTGNLYGITATANEYGIFAGSGVTVSDQYLRLSNTNFDLHNLDLSIHDGGTERIRLDHNDGMFVWNQAGTAVFGAYSGSDSGYSWGGYTLDTGDLLIGDYGRGAAILWDDSLGRFSIGYLTEIKMSGSSINFYESGVELASLTSSVWTLGIATAEHVTIDTSGVSLYDNATLYGRFASTTTLGDTSTEHIQITSTSLQFRDSTTVYTNLNSGSLTLGRVAAGQANTYLKSGSIAIRMNTTDRILLTSAGVLSINDSAGAPVFTFNASSGAEFTKPLTIGTSGGIYQGSGTFASPNTGLKIYNSSGSGILATYRNSASQVLFDTDGFLYAGGKTVRLSGSGLGLSSRGVHDANNRIRWFNGFSSVEVMNMYGDLGGGTGEYVGYLEMPDTTGNLNTFYVHLFENTGGPTRYDTLLTLTNSGTLTLNWGAGSDQHTFTRNGYSLSGSITKSSAINVRVLHTANQSGSNNAWTPIAFNQEYSDPNGFHNNTTNPDRLTIPTNFEGWYDITFQASIAASTSGSIRALQIQSNGTTSLAIKSFPVVGTSETHMEVTTKIYLTAGEYVRGLVYQDSGGALNINAHASYSPVLAIVRFA